MASRPIAPFAILLLLSATLLSGCSAGWTHLTRAKDFSQEKEAATSGTAFFVDAKQRAVLTRGMIKKGADGVTTDAWLAFCSEPSPDALSALSASGALEFSKEDKARLASTLALSEGASSIGLRTQSITLMRDAMYRLCEGYVNGAIGDLQFETLHRRFQSSMVAILAIEQLTGTVKAPAVSLSGAGSVGDPDRAADLAQKTEQSLIALRAAEKDVQTKTADASKAAETKSALEKEKAALEEKEKKGPLEASDAARKSKLEEELKVALERDKAASSALSDAKKLASDREAVFKAYDAARQAATSGSAQSTVKVQLEPASGSAAPDKIQAVASAVDSIVESTLRLGFAREFCASLLLQPDESKDAKGTKACQDYVAQDSTSAKTLADADAGVRLAMADVLKEVAERIGGMTSITAADISAITALLNAAYAATDRTEIAPALTAQ